LALFSQTFVCASMARRLVGQADTAMKDMNKKAMKKKAMKKKAAKKKAMKKGSKRQVFKGSRAMTQGGLTKASLIKNKRGKVVSASGDETDLGDEADHDYDYGWDSQQFKAYRRPLSSKGKVLGTVEFCVGLDILKFVWVYETLYFCCCHLILLLISNWLVIAVGNTVKGKRGRDGPVLC
jgi:hypothetical protein